MTGIAVPLLAACGASDDTASQPSPTEQGSTAPDGGGGGGDALAQTSEIPVGGGVILSDQQIVVTQPSADEFKAFTAVCTHQRCVVSSVEGGTITCGCHGSMFSVEDGSPTGGPAPSPLEEIPVTVRDGQVLLA